MKKIVDLLLLVIIFLMCLYTGDILARTNASSSNMKAIIDNKYGDVLEENYVYYNNEDDNLSKRAGLDFFKVFKQCDKTKRYDKVLDQEKNISEKNLFQIKQKIESLKRQDKSYKKEETRSGFYSEWFCCNNSVSD